MLTEALESILLFQIIIILGVHAWPRTNQKTIDSQ